MSDEKKRTAGKREEGRLLAGKSSGEIASAVKEIESTHRVYWRTWLAESRHETAEEAEESLRARFEGRLRPEDMRVTEDLESSKPHVAATRRWTVHSEWKHEESAEAERDALLDEGRAAEDVEVVARNSRREHVLKQVGKVKMRAEELT